MSDKKISKDKLTNITDNPEKAKQGKEEFAVVLEGVIARLRADTNRKVNVIMCVVEEGEKGEKTTEWSEEIYGCLESNATAPMANVLREAFNRAMKYEMLKVMGQLQETTD